MSTVLKKNKAPNLIKDILKTRTVIYFLHINDFEDVVLPLFKALCIYCSDLVHTQREWENIRECRHRSRAVRQKQEE